MYNDTKRQSHDWLTLYLIPTLLGLIIALLVILIKPQWFPSITAHHQNTASQNEAISPTAATPQTPPALSSPVSYSTAVERAAPAVVNIFTQRIIQEKDIHC